MTRPDGVSQGLASRGAVTFLLRLESPHITTITSSISPRALQDAAQPQPATIAPRSDPDPPMREAAPAPRRTAPAPTGDTLPLSRPQRLVHRAVASNPEPNRFDRVGKAVLIATTAMLETPEVASLAASSKPAHEALRPEVARRWVQDLMPELVKHLELEGRDIAATAHGGWDAVSLGNLSMDLLARGRHEDAERAARASIAAAPASSLGHEQLACVLLQAGRAREAIAAADRAAAMDAAGFGGGAVVARAHLLLGNAPLAQEFLQSSDAEPYEFSLIATMVEHSLGRAAEFERALDEAVRLANRAAFNRPSLMAEVYAWTGDAANASKWMQKAAQTWWDRETGRVALSPFVANIGHQPQWRALRTATRQLLDANRPALPPGLAGTEPPLREAPGVQALAAATSWAPGSSRSPLPTSSIRSR